MRWRLPDREVERLLSNLVVKSFDSRDEQEVAGYAEVMATVFASGAEISVTENHIKQLHRDLLRYGDKDERHRGEYKTASTSVAGKRLNQDVAAIFIHAPSPLEVHPTHSLCCAHPQPFSAAHPAPAKR